MKRLAILAAVLLLLTVLTGCAQPEEQPMTTTIDIVTNKGNITVELNKESAPDTVDNFLSYVDVDFYNGTIFHRVIPGFMIQGGGYTSDGQRKQTLPPVALEASLPNSRGTIAMARTNDPNSATSQFFINLDDNQFLDPGVQGPGYTVFGRVTSGMEVVDEIATVQTGSKPAADWPVEPVIIQTIKRSG